MCDCARCLTRDSVSSIERLSQRWSFDRDSVERVATRYPARISPHWMSLLQGPDDPLWKQVVPDLRELEDEAGLDDPLEEENHSPVPNLVHRYPDRVLFLVSDQCPVWCRFCTRRFKVGQRRFVTPEGVEAGIRYLQQHPEVRDVLLSGGDPLMLADGRLEEILGRLRAIPHLEILRIGSRVPGALPGRISPALCAMLRKFHPLFINLHFNHPRELSPEAVEACARLADAGIPLGSQTVLLQGVNDDPETMRRLVHRLLQARVRPYYLYQADLTKGTSHFRTRVATGIHIIESLRGHTSGLAVPTLVIDAPGGGGKVPIGPEYAMGLDGDHLVLRNYQGQVFRYPIQADGDHGR